MSGLSLEDIAPARARTAALAVIITRYATPLAVFLVSSGLLLARPGSPLRELCIGLLAFSLLFNLAVVRILRGRPESAGLLVPFRLFANLAVNILLVFFLWELWRPMWLLLSLMPLATAVYEDRSKTLTASVSVSFILLAINLLHGPQGKLAWVEPLAYAAYIILLCLMVNELTAAGRGSATEP